MGKSKQIKPKPQYIEKKELEAWEIFLQQEMMGKLGEEVYHRTMYDVGRGNYKIAAQKIIQDKELKRQWYSNKQRIIELRKEEGREY